MSWNFDMQSGIYWSTVALSRTFLCSEIKNLISSSSWLLTAAASRDDELSGGRGGSKVVEPESHTDFRASSLIAFHRDWFWKEGNDAFLASETQNAKLKAILLPPRITWYSQYMPPSEKKKRIFKHATGETPTALPGGQRHKAPQRQRADSWPESSDGWRRNPQCGRGMRV